MLPLPIVARFNEMPIAAGTASNPEEVLVNRAVGSKALFNCKTARAAGVLRRSIFWPATVLMLPAPSSWMLAFGLMNRLPVPAWDVALGARPVPKRRAAPGST